MIFIRQAEGQAKVTAAAILEFLSILRYYVHVFGAAICLLRVASHKLSQRQL